MTTTTNIKGHNHELITALYCRLSVEDIKTDAKGKKTGHIDESNSIKNQKQIYLTTAKSTATPTRCFSWMTVYPARALTEAILTVCTKW